MRKLGTIYIYCRRCKRTVNILWDEVDIPYGWTLTMELPSICGSCNSKNLDYRYNKIIFSMSDKMVTPRILTKRQLKLIGFGSYTLESEDEDLTAIGTKSIDELPLCTRTINILKRHGIEKLHQLFNLDPKFVQKHFQSIGPKTIMEIKEVLREEDLEWNKKG